MGWGGGGKEARGIGTDEESDPARQIGRRTDERTNGTTAFPGGRDHHFFSFFCVLTFVSLFQPPPEREGKTNTGPLVARLCTTTTNTPELASDLSGRVKKGDKERGKVIFRSPAPPLSLLSLPSPKTLNAGHQTHCITSSNGVKHHGSHALTAFSFPAPPLFSLSRTKPFFALFPDWISTKTQKQKTQNIYLLLFTTTTKPHSPALPISHVLHPSFPTGREKKWNRNDGRASEVSGLFCLFFFYLLGLCSVGGKRNFSFFSPLSFRATLLSVLFSPGGVRLRRRGNGSTNGARRNGGGG